MNYLGLSVLGNLSGFQLLSYLFIVENLFTKLQVVSTVIPLVDLAVF